MVSCIFVLPTLMVSCIFVLVQCQGMVTFAHAVNGGHGLALCRVLGTKGVLAHRRAHAASDRNADCFAQH